jgi:glycerol kinase
VIAEVISKSRIGPEDIAAIGITNQRETTIIWDKNTGRPYCNAIVWQDTRTKDICDQLTQDGGIDRFRPKVGLPLATYFSGPKIRWILENSSEARVAAQKGDALFGNIDTWLIWQLTGGPGKGVHVTDVSNASRTMLMNLKTLDWDAEILQILASRVICCPRSYPRANRISTVGLWRKVHLDCQYQFAAILGISRLRWLDRRVSVLVKRRILMARVASC